MTDREKLIEVLGEFLLWPSKMKHVWMPQGIEKLADHLIANGVTVQRWIPVTDRLPEKDLLVLCVGIKGGMFLGCPRSTGTDGTAYTYVPNARGGRYTKYWMPLPEPPEGK